MLVNGQTLIGYIERLAPKHYAMEGDRIGLQVGTLGKKVSKALVALDVTEEVVKEAIAMQAGLIIAHHAVIYRPLTGVLTDTPAGRLIGKLIKHDIAVYIAHTNLDVAQGGVNDMLAEAIGLQNTKPLEELHSDKLKKLAVFVPESHHEQVLQAIFSAGAGQIGRYSHCSFNTEGTGTYMPGEGTNPYAGRQGKLERAREIRIETVVPASLERRVIQAMLKAHPYEEVAYDVYPMDLKGQTFGIGRVGTLEDGSIPLSALAEKVKAAYGLQGLRVVGDPDLPVRKIAVLGGSGGKYVRHARFAGADVLITGDIDHHTAHDALADGVALIDAGHHIEQIMKEGTARYLNERLRDDGYSTEVAASGVDTDPFRFL